MADTIVLIIEPVLQGPHRVHRGRYAAWLDDRCIVKAKEPFLAAARILLREGVDPSTPLTMRHRGSQTIALRSTVGGAAKWDVKDDEDGPRFVPFSDRREDRPDDSPIEFDEEALAEEPSDKETHPHVAAPPMAGIRR